MFFLLISIKKKTHKKVVRAYLPSPDMIKVDLPPVMIWENAKKGSFLSSLAG